MFTACNVRTLIVALVPLAPLAAQGEPKAAPKEGFEHALPADAIGFLGIADVDALGADIKSSAMGRWWFDPANAPVRDALSKQMDAVGAQVEAKLGADPLEVFGHLHGRFGFAGIGHFLPDERDNPVGLSLALLADTGADRDAVEKLVTTLTGQITGDDVVSKSSSVGEAEVSAFDFMEDGEAKGRLQVAFHGETLVATLSFLPVEKDAMERLLAGLDGESSGSLAGAPRFKDSLAAKAGGIQLWVDAAALAKAGQVSVEADIKRHADGDFFKEYYADFLETFRNMGMLDVDCFAAHVGWSAQGSHGEMRLTWPGDGWIPTFARLVLGPGGESLFASVPTSVLSATCLQVDFPGIFDAAMAALIKSGEMQPSDATDFLTQSEQELGFNVRDDLLDMLDGRVGIVSSRVPSEERFPMSQGDPQNVVALLGVKEGPAMASLLEGVLRQTGLIAARQRAEFQGFELFNVPFMPGMSVNYSVLPDMLVVSTSSTLVQDILRRKTSGSDLPVVANDEGYKSRRALLKSPLGLVQYADAAESMKNLSALLDMLREEMKSEAARARPDDPEGMLAAFLVALPPFDQAALEKHMKGATVVSVSADEGGFSVQTTSP